jgi:histidinol-phosphate aminotransferase
MKNKYNYLHFIGTKLATSTDNYCLTNNEDENYKSFFSNILARETPDSLFNYPQEYNISVINKIKKAFNLKNIVLGAGSEDLILRSNQIINENNWRTGIVLPIFYRVQESLDIWEPISKKQFLQGNLGPYQAIWICNPNPYSGEVIEKKAIVQQMSKYPQKLFLVDETAMFFLEKRSNYSLVGENLKTNNFVVFSSFSKLHGIAGLRAGFASGNKDFLDKLNQRGNTFPYTSVTEKMVEKILDNLIFFNKIRKKIESNKAKLEEILCSNPEILVRPSVTNCLIFRHQRRKLFNDLLKEGVAGLDLDTQEGIKGKGFVRLTVHSSSIKHKILVQKLKRVILKK